MTRGECKWAAFWDWVERVMREKGLSFRQIELQAGLSNAAVGQRARECLRPTETTFEALAQAFDMPKREIMEVAGVIEPEEAARSTTFREILRLMRRLTPSQREVELRRLRFQYPDINRSLRLENAGEDNPED